ncbi:DUF84 family protein [Planococcus sp. FY231025]|uniref:DUF84 family protein n=1 Tax=Planococcus sp. FY231025 TaxID=3455699 RepID=UPI003F8F7631
MKKIQAAIASKNQAKIKAVSSALEEFGLAFELHSKKAASGVADQPRSLEETRKGAINRAKALAEQPLDFAIGLEGGVYEIGGVMYVCNWGALATPEGRLWTAAGAQIPLPESIAGKLREGRELGPVMDEYAEETGTRQHKGAVGILTNGAVNRDEMFSHVVKLLLGQYMRSSEEVACASKHL